MKRYAIIMAGGAGERFWPLSRIKRPKHLWNVSGGKKSLLEMTFERVSKLVGANNVFVITNVEQIAGIKKYCPLIPSKNLVAEPLGRDTTAAIGLAATIVNRASKGEDSSFAVFPSDHVIGDTKGFCKTINLAFKVAESGDNLVTVGIEPTHPATGFGYIERGASLCEGGEKYFKIKRFREKPKLADAKRFVESGKFYWNAGMFVWRTSSILKALKTNVPATYKIFEKISKALEKGESLKKTLGENYPNIEKISIDFSVMESAKNSFVVPSGFDWDDVGSWNAIERHGKCDSGKNFTVGEAYLGDSKNCTLFDVSGRATVLFGVENLVVVHTQDATLVCSKDSAEGLKNIVKTLPKKYR